MEPNEVELMEHRAVVDVPEDSVELEIVAKVYHDGEIINVSKKYSMPEIRKIFRKADEGYIDDDDRFYITDKGREFLESLERGGNE